VNAVLLRPLPFTDPDRLVWIENVGTGGLSARTTRVDTLQAWRAENTSFEGVAGYFAFFDFGRRQTMTGSGDPERLRRVANILKGKPGPSPLYFEIMTDGGLRVRMRASDNTVVCCDNELIQMLEDELGAGSVSIGRNMNGNGKSNGGSPPPTYKSNGPRPYRNGQPAGR